MSIVGRAYVTVRAITAQLDRDIEQGVNKAIRNADVDRSADRVGERISERVEQRVKDRDPVSNAFKSTSTDFDKIGNDLAEHISAGLGVGLNRRRDRIRRSVEGAFSRGLAGNVAEAFGQSFAFGIAKVGPLLLQPMVALAATAPAILAPALAAIGGFVESAIPLIAPLGPAIAASAAVGVTGLVGLVSAMTVMKLAFKSGTPEVTKFKAETKGLFDDIGTSVRKELLPTLADSLKQIHTGLGPTLKTGLTGVASAVGDVSKQFASLAKNSRFQSQLGSVFATGATTTRQFGGSLLNVSRALVAIAAAAGPVTTRFGAFVQQLTKSAADSASTGAQLGTLTDFFNRAGDVAAQFGRIFGNIFRGLGGTFSAALGPGQRLLDGIERLTSRFDRFANSARGARILADSFDRAVDTAQAVNRLIGAIVHQLSQVGVGNDGLTGLIDNLAKNGVPALAAAIGTVTRVSEDIVRAVGPALTKLLQDVGPNLAATVSKIADSLGPALSDLEPTFANIINGILDVVKALAPATRVLGQAGAVVGSVVVPPLQILAKVLDALPDSITGTITALGLLRLAMSRIQATNLAGTMVEGTRQLNFFGRGVEAARGRLSTFRGGAVAAGLSVAAIGLESSKTARTTGLSAAAMGASIGSLAGPWGAVGGAVVGYIGHVLAAKDTTSAVLAQAQAATASGNLRSMETALTRLNAESARVSKGIPDGLGRLVPTIKSIFDKRTWTTNLSLEDMLVGDINKQKAPLLRKIQAVKNAIKLDRLDARIDLRGVTQQIDSLKQQFNGKLSLDIDTPGGPETVRTLFNIRDALAATGRDSRSLALAQKAVRDIGTSAGVSGPLLDALTAKLTGTKNAVLRIPVTKPIKIDTNTQQVLRDLGFTQREIDHLQGKDIPIKPKVDPKALSDVETGLESLTRHLGDLVSTGSSNSKPVELNATVNGQVEVDKLTNSVKNLPPSKATRISATGAATAAKQVQSVATNAGKIRGSKAIRVSTPGAATSGKALDNVAKKAAAVKGSRSVKVSAPGATAAAKDVDGVASSVSKLKPKAVKISAPGATSAKSQVDGLKKSINGLQDKTVTITYKRRVTGPAPPPGATTAATGGWIRGPGSETSDSIPTMLSNNEFVVRASQARKYASLLEAINGGYGPGVLSKFTDQAGHQSSRIAIRGPVSGSSGGDGSNDATRLVLLEGKVSMDASGHLFIRAVAKDEAKKVVAHTNMRRKM